MPDRTDLPEPHIVNARTEHVDVDGASLWTITSGEGAPLVVCHGGPGLWDDLGDVAATVDDVATVHRYDQRGCGRSTGDGPYSIARFVADLDELRTHSGHDRWIVGGHSWGASLALQYALAHPERVRALVLIAGTGAGTAWKAAYRRERAERLGNRYARYELLDGRSRTSEEDREYVILTWSTDFADRDHAAEHAAHLLRDHELRVNYECNARINAETGALDEANLLARCAELRAPVLIIHGSEDPRPLSATDSLLGTLPDARREVIEGCGHFPWVERPREFREAMRAFVTEHAHR